MKVGVMVAVGLLSGSVIAAQKPEGPIDALDGIDTVVLLRDGKEAFGKSAFRSDHGRFTYLFSSAETKAEFDKAPEKYAIQMGGLCARMGRTVTGNPSDYLVHDGKIYIFGSDACHKLFASAPEKYLQKPAAPMPRDTAASTRGQALLDKAARQLGVKLDTMASYVEMTSETQKRPTGDIQITTRKAWRFPDGARSERMMTRPDGQKVSYGTLLTANGAWQIGGPELSPVIPEAVPSVQLDLGRQVLPLLRSRREAGTQVATLGAATIDGVSVERVRVKRGGHDVTLNLDAATGRVHSTSFIDRGRDGQFGEYTLVYSDFRAVDGVTVPFEEKAVFNGTVEPALSRKLESVSINGPLDEALFKVSR